MAEQGAWDASMAEQEAWEAMADRGAWEASMVGSPPKKNFLGKLFSGGCSGGAVARGSGEPDVTGRGSGEPDVNRQGLW